MDNFDPAKDVIDLSNIDADIFTPGVQNFTFIGDAPFSDGAQVRYQLNPATNTTTVQARLAGDPSRRFYANARWTRAAHLRQLRAHAVSVGSRIWRMQQRFRLQRDPLVAGAPTEYEYSNVQGKAYSSYEAFYVSGTYDLAADDLNLSSNANELVLYDPNQTVTRGGGSESLQVGRIE